MIGTFLIVLASSITMQSLGKIVLRTLAVDVNVVFFSAMLRVRRAVRSRGA